MRNKMETKVDQATRFGVSQTVSEILGRRPVLDTVLSVITPLFNLREELIQNLSGQLHHETPATAKKQGGVSLLPGESMEWARNHLLLSARRILPALDEFTWIVPQVEAMQSALDDGALDLVSLSETILAQDERGLKRVAKGLGVSPEILGFVMTQVLGPVLASAAKRIAGDFTLATWKQGYCPICGSWPSIGYLERSKDDGGLSEFLRGGGGDKYLHCSLCGFEWQFRRGACPVCQKDEPGTIETLYADNETSERLEVCSRCRTYCPCIDLRGIQHTPSMHVAVVSMLPLEFRAREQGYNPICVSYWNELD
jgi:FdhE protein